MCICMSTCKYMYTYVYIYTHMNVYTAYPIWGDVFKKIFQSSKLEARTSLFTETWQKRRSSFEL